MGEVLSVVIVRNFRDQHDSNRLQAWVLVLAVVTEDQACPSAMG